MTGRPLGRPVGHARRRTSPIRRRSAGLTPARAGGLLLMLAAGLAVYGLASSSVFGLERLRVEGAVLTDAATVRAVAGIAPGTNLMTLETAAVTTAVESLPTVRRAEVSVGLPGTVDVRVQERTPILVWTVGDHRFLVDIEGLIIDELPSGAPVPDAPPGADGAPGAPLPVIVDARPASGLDGVGGRVDPVDLDAARRLASLRPADVGSSATGLTVSVDDTDGFVVRPVGGAWMAVFGFYTPSLRTTDLIPGQVRLLRSLLIGREGEVAQVILASATDGTYIPRPSPSAKPTPKP